MSVVASMHTAVKVCLTLSPVLSGAYSPPLLPNTWGNKAMSAAARAALKGVEKGATKAVDHVIDKVTRLRERRMPTQRINVQRSNAQQTRLNNLISGSGIATIHDFVQRDK